MSPAINNVGKKQQSPGISKIDYKAPATYEGYMNMAFFRIFSDYFNILKQNPKIAKKNGIKNITFFRQKTFLPSIELQFYSGETNIRFSLNGNIYN